MVQLAVLRPRVTATEPWSRSAFEQQLRAKERFYHIHHPFHTAMNGTGISRDAVRGWVANRFYYQQAIPV
ncbi:MAG: pyrroloquinoline-quinone synthase PqqC, partial [Gammaproteobacteria bacterium]